MKTLVRSFQQVIHRWILWAMAVDLLFTALLSPICFLLQDWEMIRNMNAAFLVMFAVAYGLTRCLLFHPAVNSKYRQFLALTPYSSRHQLPKGPILLYWPDAVILGLMTAAAWICPPEHCFVPLISFLLAHLAGHCFCMILTKQKKLLAVLLTILPLSVYPHENGMISFFVLCIAYGIVWYGTQAYLKQFPWNTSFWNDHCIAHLKEKAFTQKIIQWPWYQLNFDKTASLSWKTKLVICGLVFWWLHVIVYMFKDCHFIDMVAILAVPIILFRLIPYAKGFMPPISLLGRISTGRLIIPGYDKIFVATIILVLTVLFVPEVLRSTGLPQTIGIELTFSLCLFLAMVLPPSYQSWRLTGHHRMIKTPVRPQRSGTTAHDKTDEYLIDLWHHWST
ncbi:MAG: hypothetical protein JXB18_10905 [Sedimentisphaerales bacterium]|nr:hypothetical protein [Sedimentisphaerales bacterium]